MRHLPVALIAFVLFGICGCSEVTGGSGVSVSKPEPIRCQAGTDCDLKWRKAYEWVIESSGLKLKTKTDDLIKTEESSRESRTLVVTITKTLPRSRAFTRSISLEDVLVCSAASLPSQNPVQALQILFRQLTSGHSALSQETKLTRAVE